MAGRRGTETRAMANQVFVRMGTDLAQACEAAAAAAGLTCAAWLRSLAVQALDAAPEHARPSRPVCKPAVDVEALASLSRKVARLNGSIVQLAKAARESGATWHADVEEILGGMRQAQQDLVGEVEARR